MGITHISQFLEENLRKMSTTISNIGLILKKWKYELLQKHVFLSNHF